MSPARKFLALLWVASTIFIFSLTPGAVKNLFELKIAFAISFSNIQAMHITGSGAQIIWRTDEAADSKVLYGTSTAYGLFSDSRCDGGGNVTSHCVNLTGLTENTTYFYRVGSGSGYSGGYQFTSASDGGDTIPPGAVTDLSVSNPTENSLVLSWTATGDDGNIGTASGYVIKYSTTGAITDLNWPSAIQVSGQLPEPAPPGTPQTFTVSGLNASITYWFAIKTFDEVGNYSISNSPSGTTRTPNVSGGGGGGSGGNISPAAPSGLTYNLSENGTRVNLTWTDNSTNETRFEIYRQTGGVWSYLAQVEADVTSFRDTPPAGTYYYNIAACNGSTINIGCSTNSNTVGPIIISALTPLSTTSTPTSTVPNAPSGLTATLSPLSGEVVLNWSDNSINEDRFEIYNRTAGSVSWNYLYGLSQNSTSFTYPSHPYGTYEYLVKACNYGGCSESNIITITKSITYATTTLSAFIEGTITDSGNRPISGAWAHVYSSDYSRNFGGASDSRGNYRLAIPSGNYWIEFFPPAGREDLLRPAPQSFSVAEGETKRVNIVFGTRAAANKVISGRIAFPNGTAVIDAEVGAYSYTSGEWLKTLVDGNGVYSLKVGPGKWKVGFRPMNPEMAGWRFTNEFREVEFRRDLSEETQTVNFSVALAETLLKVKTVDDQGKALSGVGVILDTVSSKITVPLQNQPTPEFRKTDSVGLANFRLPIGRYYLRAFLPPEKELIAPDELLVNIISSEQKDITLVFKRKSVFAEALIRGRVTLDTGRPTDAFVWG